MNIIFFEMIKKMVVKYSTAKVRDISRELEYEISDLISKSIAAEEPVDIYSMMGKEKIEISIFDEKFLANLQNMAQKNYAAELLAKIVKDQIVVRMNINPFRYRTLYEALTRIVENYNVKLLSASEIMEELVKIAQQLKKEMDEGKEIKLTEEELAFYDLLVSRENPWRFRPIIFNPPNLKGIPAPMV